MRRLARSLFALLALFVPTLANAQLDCTAQNVCAPPLNPGDPVEDARACLCDSTTFFDEDFRVEIQTQSFDQVLPPVYEVGVPDRYSETGVDAVIAWAKNGARTTEKDEVLFEAAFRKASAHGMFGDHHFVNGLNASFDGNLTNPIFDGLLLLDDRSCSSTPDRLCSVDADCPGGETCAPVRVGGLPNGAFGAVQEYRRAERALAEAIERLGADDFRGLDAANGDCGSLGCAARLLVRLGGMKARAQAARADRLWELATAAAGPMADAPTCSLGAIGEACSVHADCGLGGVCGSSAAEQRFVALRQAVGEALAEGAALQSLYAVLAGPGGLSTSPDLVQLSLALAELEEIETRAAKAETPFGLPPNYVPLLSSVQEGVIGCSQECTGSSCDLTSFFGCLLALADGNGQLSVLGAAESQLNAAQISADDFAERTRDAALHEAETQNALRSVIERLFGQSCIDCACAVGGLTQEEQESSCVSFGGEVWQVSAAVCDDLGNPFGSCSTQFVDGELERQLQAVRNSQLGLDNLGKDLVRNEAARLQAEESFRQIAEANGEACTGIETTIETAFADTSSTLQGEQKSGLEVGLDVWLGWSGGGLSGAGTGASVAGPVGAAAFGIVGAFQGAITAGLDAQAEADAIDAETQLRSIEKNREVAIEQIRCIQESKLVDVEEGDALFQIATERLGLTGQALEQRGAIVESQIRANQLLSELIRAEARFSEAQELALIWGPGSGVRNPQNYRTVILEKQLQAGESFRSAQILTWLILRTAAYDLARPDFLAPQRFTASDVIELGANQCVQSSCEDPISGFTGTSCIVDSDCAIGESCSLDTSQTAGMADSNGACSLQAVFAARTVDDLRHLIRSAFLAQAATFRTLASCGQGNCQKTILLRDLFTDPTLGASRPRLGALMKSEGLPEVEFEITLRRRYELCEDLPPPSFELLCQPSGVAALRNDGTGPGENLADNLYNARFLQVGGVVRYDPLTDPTAMLCRDPLTGVPVAPTSCVSSAQCPACGVDLFGNPIPCSCRTIFDGDPVAELVQLGPGTVRSERAQRISSLDDDCQGSACPVDSFLRYEVRSGDLPLTGAPPSFDFFRVVDLLLFQDTGTALVSMNANIKGVPVASPRWRLRIDTEGLADERFQDAYLDSIEDVELILDYQAFNVPTGN